MTDNKQPDPANTSPQIIPVLLAGGRGQRLWPLSRDKRPKPFIRVVGRPSMFEKTWKRIEAFNDVIVCGNINHHDVITQQIPAEKLNRTQIILEPQSRGTAPAVAMAAHYLSHTKPDAVMCLMPTDHFIAKDNILMQAMENAGSFINEAPDEPRIAALGVRPVNQDLRYGYFRIPKGSDPDEIHKAIEFTEKPSKAVATEMMYEGRVLWNSGIVLCKPDVLLSVLKKTEPDLYAHTKKAVKFAGRAKTAIVIQDQYFDAVQPASIDRSVLENADDVYVHRLQTEWRDNGTWTSFLYAVFMGK